MKTLYFICVYFYVKRITCVGQGTFYDDDEERSTGDEGAPEGMGEESRAGAATLPPPMAASL
jgi:hypothetical protein